MISNGLGPVQDRTNGCPVTAVNAPVVELMLNAPTLLVPLFAEYKNRDPGSIATPHGVLPAPVEKGDPAIAANAPVVALILKASIDPLTSDTEYRNFP